MNRNTHLCVDLKTKMQEDVLLAIGQCYRGVLTRDHEEHYLFEEEVHTSGHRPKRNPKLFDGNFCSLVHMANGKYQIHMKTIDATGITDRNDFAFKVYTELLDAFKIID